MSINGVIGSLLAQYTECDIKNSPFIVGVDGLGGAGKTTFVKKLKRDLEDQGCEILLLHLDDYIVENNKRYDTGFEEWYEYYYLQWDIQLLQTELFEKLHNGEKVLALPFYDRENDRVVKEEKRIRSAQIVLIEGIFIQRKEWKSYFDFLIFVDCPSEERKKRVLNRDLYLGDYSRRLNKYESRYWPAEEYYISMENPLDKADIIYNSKRGIKK